LPKFKAHKSNIFSVLQEV